MQFVLSEQKMPVSQLIDAEPGQAVSYKLNEFSKTDDEMYLVLKEDSAYVNVPSGKIPVVDLETYTIRYGDPIDKVIIYDVIDLTLVKAK